jgi:hypothetical protein
MIEIIETFIAALSLAIAVEYVVFYAFGFRSIDNFLMIAAINLVTNPLMNYFILAMQSLNLFTLNLLSVLFLELIVVVVEWRMLIYLTLGNAKRLLAISLVMNFCSFGCGLVLSFFFSPPFMRLL